MKKLFSIILSICILSGVFVGANVIVGANDYTKYGAVDKIVIDHVVYAKVELADGKVSDYYMVDKFFDSVEYAKTATEVNIADKVNGFPVTIINVDASYVDGVVDGLNVTKITLPDTIIEIGEYSFYNFKKVKTLHLPDSLEIIRPRAFNYMTSLESIIIPEKVTEIPQGAFAWCESLKEVKYKGKVTEISDSTFLNCESLKNITFPETLKRIGESAFAGSGLESIKIPADIISSDYVFGDCLSLKKVVYTGSVSKNGVFGIYDSTFFGCKKLEKVYLPKGAEKINIGDYAFYNCKSLNKIYNTSKIDSIGNNAFENCRSLVSFTIPSKVKKIEVETFKGCKSLKKVIFNGKKVPKIGKDVFKNTKNGIKLVVKNKTLASKLKSNIKSKGVKNVRIYVGKKLTFKNVK